MDPPCRTLWRGVSKLSWIGGLGAKPNGTSQEQHARGKVHESEPYGEFLGPTFMFVIVG